MDIIGLVRNWVKEKYTSDNHLLRSEYWIKEIRRKGIIDV